jgi:hypothetical protein
MGEVSTHPSSRLSQVVCSWRFVVMISCGVESALHQAFGYVNRIHNTQHRKGGIRLSSVQNQAALGISAFLQHSSNLGNRKAWRM